MEYMVDLCQPYKDLYPVFSLFLLFFNYFSFYFEFFFSRCLKVSECKLLKLIFHY